MEFKFLKKNIKKLYYTEFLHCHPEHKRGIFSRKATLSQRFLTSFGMTRELNLLKMTKKAALLFENLFPWPRRAAGPITRGRFTTFRSGLVAATFISRGYYFFIG